MSIDSSSKAALHKGYKHWCPEVEPREDWDKDFNFVLIRSIEELKKLDVEHKFVAWDTETSGLNPDIDWLVGFSFSFDGVTGYYVPVKHDDIALGKEALDIFYSILSKAGTQFLYNCRFDQRFFEAAGYSLEGLRYYDVMNAIWLADTNVLMPSLKVSERRFLGWIPKTFSETLGEATTFQHVPAEDAYKYACTDALGTYHLALISNQFYKESYPASKYDNDALYPMMRLENTPQRLDLEYLKSLCSSVETRIEESLQQVYQLAGCTFNVNSPAQFGKIMLERFGVDTGVRTPTGAMKADLKTLEAWLVKHGSKVSPEVKDFLSAYKEYKKTVKFKSSYLDKYIKAAEDAETFPIRFSYKFQSVPCLTENNTVLTKSRGFVSIKDVQSEDMIWTSWGYKRVLWNHSHEVDEFYRVTLKNGMTLEGTGHHPVLVRKSPLEKVAYSGMTKDDVEWAGIQDLKPDEPIVINHAHASLSCKDPWKSSLARIMGYFYGKGKMTDGVLMSLCFDNPDLAYHYAGWMKSLFGDKKVSQYDVDKGKVEYSITRQTLAKFLAEHEVIPTVEEDRLGNLKVKPVSTYTKVADRLSRMPDTFRHFLAGYLDSAKTSVRELGYKEIPEDWADGVTKDRVIFVIPSACKDVIIPMFWASAIDCKVTDHTFKAWFGEGKVTRVEVSDPYSLSNLLSVWNNLDVGLARFSCVELPKTFRLYTESMVQSVERVPAKNTVYDIEVEDVHEYVAGGIVTHNTGRLSCGGDKKNSFFTQNNVQSTPKPHSLMVKGRKATQEEIDQGKDILGWYLSNDIPDDEAVGLVEGMDPDHFNLRRAFLPKDDDCYVVSIDMKAEELRLVANIYNEKTWADAFIHGKDVHKACYSPDTEFLVRKHGWMTADRITADMEIAYYDPMDDEVKFSKAGKRYSHEASEVYTHPALFNVTDNHRMWIGTPDVGFRIVRASELKSQGNPKQMFRMKTAVGQRMSFRFIEASWGRKMGQYFCYGFMYFAPHYSDEDGFVHITLDSPCPKCPYDFAIFLHSGDFSSTEFSVDKELSFGFKSFEASHPCTDLFSLAKTKYKDEPVFLQDFVYGMLMYLSSTKFNTLNLGDGSKVSGKVVVSSKEHADAIQWLLMLTGSTCRVAPSKSSLYGEGAYVLTIFADVSSLPKSLGSTFGSVKQKNIAEKHLTYSCFSVPSGLLVTRYKGQITVNGNTAIKLFGEENYSKEARKKAKVASFGILYGSGAQGFNSSFPEMSLDECRQFLAKFKEALPSIEQGQAENVSYAREHGTINTGYGRQRRVRSYFQSGDRAQMAFAERTVKNCYSPDTEYLTKDGWKLASEISPTTQLAYYEPEMGVIRYCDAGMRYTNVCTESMKFRSRNADWDVTTNHRMWIRSTSHDRWRPCEAGALENLSVWQEVCSANLCESLVCTSDIQTPLGPFPRKVLAQLFAWVLTDSSITKKEHYIICTQNKPENFSMIEGIFTQFGAKVSIRNCVQASSGKEMRAYLAKPEFCEWVLSQIGGRLKPERRVPEWVFTSSKEVREEFLKCLVKADGTVSKSSKKEGCSFYSANKALIDDVQILFTMTGFRAGLQTYHNANGTEVYRLNCVKTSVRNMDNRVRKNGYRQLTRMKHSPIEYSCFSVPSQILVTRHNGKVTFGMNTVVQGTAADVLKLIFCRLWANVFKPYPDVTFMSTIHDEVNFSMPKRLAREVIPICMECMTIRRDDWPVTLECSLSIGRDSLGDLIPFTYNKETKEFIPEWEESSEVLKKRVGHVETKPSDNESLDVEESDDPYFGLPPEACEF